MTSKEDVYRLVQTDKAASTWKERKGEERRWKERKRKERKWKNSQIKTVLVSASMRKWIHVIWVLPKGTSMESAADGSTFHTGGASLSHLHFVTSNPSSLSDSFSFICRCIPSSCVYFGEASLQSLSEILSLTSIFDCQHLCLPACARMNKQCKTTLCVQR